VTTIKWDCRDFAALTPADLYALLQLRQRVFVVEQNCAYLDADGLDPACVHLMGWSATPEPPDPLATEPGEFTPPSDSPPSLVAYARLIPPAVKYPQSSIGRVATHPRWRGLGLGKELMAQAMERSRAAGWMGPLIIQAQIYLENFYEGFGFSRISEPYVEDGITHVDMLIE
jgi:ElaA protein